MIRKITALLLICSSLFAALSLTSCHGSKVEKTFDLPQTFDENENYEITFWAKNENNKLQQNIYKEAVADFMEIYPNIKVNLKLYSDYNEIYRDVLTNMSTDTTPNVCITYPDHIATYMSDSTAIVPLDSLMTNPEYGLGGSKVKFDSPEIEEIIPEFLDECVLGGSYYALPFMRSTEACYINADMVKALGYEIPEILTWDFIWEVSDAAMALGKETDEQGNEVYKLNGQKVLIPFIYKSTDNMMIQMIEQKGAEYSNANSDILIFNEDTEEILYEIAEHAENRSFSTFKISSYPGNYLNAGQCIFAIDSTAGSTWMGTDAPLIDIAEEELKNFETVVRPIPQYDTENPKMISQGPSVCIFNKSDSGEVMASWLFLQYLLTNKVQISYSQTEGYVPVTSKAQNSPEYLDYLSRKGEDNNTYYNIKLEATELLLNNIDNTFVTPVFNGSASLRNAAGQLIENVVKSVRRNEKITDSYIKKLYKDVTSLYKLDDVSAIAGERQKKEFGPLPASAIFLISALSVTWIGIAAYFITKKAKTFKK